MTPGLIITCVAVYSALLFCITWLTSRKNDNAGFFTGNKNSRWYVVAYGMIGASLSGVTFMSVPGWVGTQQFSYLVVVLGYFVGYLIIAGVLMPMYYRLRLTSIYGYLERRFGIFSYKTGAFFFILSRTIGAAFRMFLVVSVLQHFVFDRMQVPFFVTAASFILLILLYTFEGGIKTIVWTDTLQTTFMLLALVISVSLMIRQMNIPFFSMLEKVKTSDYSKIWFSGWNDERSGIKQFLSGIFICVAMTGLDQEMMQKNLSCKNLKEAQKNMISFSIVLIFVNFLFLFLGAVLYFYAQSISMDIPGKTDNLFPEIALSHLGPFAGIVFIIGLISAAYPSADGALTSLTTSVCVDFLGFEKKPDFPNKKKIRYAVHISFALLLLGVIVLFENLNNTAIVEKLFKVGGYTYGPLLGLFSFGLFTRYPLKDRWTPLVCLLAPFCSWIVNENSALWMHGFRFGFLILPLNALLTFTGLWLIRKPYSEQCAE